MSGAIKRKVLKYLIGSDANVTEDYAARNGARTFDPKEFAPSGVSKDIQTSTLYLQHLAKSQRDTTAQLYVKV